METIKIIKGLSMNFKEMSDFWTEEMDTILTTLENCGLKKKLETRCYLHLDEVKEFYASAKIMDNEIRSVVQRNAFIFSVKMVGKMLGLSTEGNENLDFLKAQFDLDVWEQMTRSRENFNMCCMKNTLKDE